MPWKESGVVEERMRFVRDYEREEMTMAELCRFYGIARKTGYEMVQRWQEHGAEGLKDRSRSPLRHPNQTAAEIEAELLELRRAHMRWGPRKLREILRRSRDTVLRPVSSRVQRATAARSPGHANSSGGLQRAAATVSQPCAGAGI